MNWEYITKKHSQETEYCSSWIEKKGAVQLAVEY